MGEKRQEKMAVVGKRERDVNSLSNFVISGPGVMSGTVVNKGNIQDNLETGWIKRVAGHFFFG